MPDKVLFVDRDGTLIAEPDDQQVDAIDKLRLLPGVVPALLSLVNSGYRLVMVSNQDGLGTASFPTEDFEGPQQFLLGLLSSQGINFDHVFICPHLPSDQCACRKPRTGLVTRFLAETDLDLERSAVVGDRETDAQFAENIGVRSFTVQEDGDYDRSWAFVSNAILTAQRTGSVVRTTRETDVRVRANLDDKGPSQIDTGIGFFDHMLEQIAKHGDFRLRVECKGDLQVDEHHTVEDVALCFGEALRKALGDKRGIGRYGFVVPMDESEARVSIDLSGRAFCVFQADIGRERVGGLPTELVPHFFHSFADTLGAAVHIEIMGDNAHHMVEASFKALGRALRQALRTDGSALPSTKGVLA